MLKPVVLGQSKPMISCRFQSKACASSRRGLRARQTGLRGGRPRWACGRPATRANTSAHWCPHGGSGVWGFLRASRREQGPGILFEMWCLDNPHTGCEITVRGAFQTGRGRTGARRNSLSSRRLLLSALCHAASRPPRNCHPRPWTPGSAICDKHPVHHDDPETVGEGK